MSSETIEVVAAVIERDARYLITLRPSGTHLAGCWEFPGGKTLPDETHTQALIRELDEELALPIAVQHPLLSVTHAYPERSIRLHFYQARALGSPRAVLGQEMRWATAAELSELPFPPADAELIRRLSAG